MWAGIREVFPEKRVKGSVFHWTHALYRHVQSEGLQQAYHNDLGTRTFIRRLMALAFIRKAHILRMFLQLSSTVEDDRLTGMASYVYNTWIDGSVWPPSAWGVFMQNVRTNNDVEGWHHRINNKAGRGQIQFYLLLDLLQEEAKFLKVQTALVRDDKYSRHRRREYKRVNDSVGIGARSFNIDRSSHGTADIDTYYQHFNIETTYKKQTKTK